jgi:hypothetical protein
MLNKTNFFVKFNSLFLLGLIAIGVGIRMPSMFLALDGDEGTNYTYFGALPWAELFTKYLDPQQHTLYIAVAYMFRWVFGESELVFRLPALLTAMLSVILIYKISLKITHSTFVSFLAATLLNFSFLNFEYSVRGRGYTLTLFLSLLLINAVLEIYKNKRPIFWSLIFVSGGLFLVMTLPSNVFFLAGVSIFFLILKCKNKKLSALVSSKKFYKEISFIIFTAIISLSYFGIIWSDLVKGVSIAENYAVSVGENIHWSFLRFIKTWAGLLQPWGGLLLVSFAYGVIKLRNNYYLKVFTGFLLFILVFQGILNILPPPRAIVFLLPVVLIISAYGIRRGLYLVKNFSHVYKNVAFIFFWTLVLIPAYFKFSDFNKERVIKTHSAKIAESKQALAYLKNKITDNSLIILPKIDRALNHYLVKEVTKRNVNVVKNRKLKNIFFFGSQPFDFLSYGAPWKKPKNEWFQKSDIPKNIFKKIKKIGRLGIYKFSGRIKNLSNNADYENFILQKSSNSSLSISPNYKIPIEGEFSLDILNKTTKPIKIKTKESPDLNFSSWALILQVYLNKHANPGHIVFTYRRGGGFPFVYFLNLFQGAFKINNDQSVFPFERFPLEYLHKHAWKQSSQVVPKENWLIDLKLTPLRKKVPLDLYFSIGPNKTALDGLGYYLLGP